MERIMNTASNMATTPTVISIAELLFEKKCPHANQCDNHRNTDFNVSGHVEVRCLEFRRLVGWYRGCSCLARQQRFGLKIFLM